MGSSLVFIKIPNTNFNLNGELDLIRSVSTGNRTCEMRTHVAAQLGFKRKIQSGREAMNIWKSWADIINRIVEKERFLSVGPNHCLLFFLNAV